MAVFQGHATTVFGKISFGRSNDCLEILYKAKHFYITVPLDVEFPLNSLRFSKV